jgi:uncharacterized peroxidase-related enzyme
MSRIAIPAAAAIPAASQSILDAVGKSLGVVPNLFKLEGLSTAALEGHVGLNSAVGKTLDVKTRERIALAVAQVNGCDYCLSAHTYLGLNVARLDATEIDAARHGRSADVKADAAVAFARKVSELRGKIADADLALVRAAGFSDAQVIEIVTNVALNTLTNLINNVAQTDIDFPKVSAQSLGLDAA